MRRSHCISFGLSAIGLRAAHAGEVLVSEVAASPTAVTKPNLLIHAKACMMDKDYEPYVI